MVEIKTTHDIIRDEVFLNDVLCVHQIRKKNEFKKWANVEEQKKEYLEIRSWVNREINIIVEQIKGQNRYSKTFSEGALNSLKKVQTLIDNKENMLFGDE